MMKFLIYSKTTNEFYYFFLLKSSTNRSIKNDVKEIEEFHHIQGNEIEKKTEITNTFNDDRQKGENETHICKLIREDLIEEFIIYVNKTNCPLSQTIETSTFETNSLLLNKEPTLIEYSAFFGSFQIFKYLYFNEAKIESTIWKYAIHGNNPELICFLEDNHIKPKDETYEENLEESIKCHHNDIADYLLNNYIKEEDKENYDKNVFAYGFHYRNFFYFPKLSECYFIFYYACEYNYINIVKYFLKKQNFDNIVILM